MPRTRSSVAPEPLKQLSTPPKRTRKQKTKPLLPAIVEEPRQESSVPLKDPYPVAVVSPEIVDVTMLGANSPFPTVEETTTAPEPEVDEMSTLSKRRRDDEDDVPTSSKRARKIATPSQEPANITWMFANGTTDSDPSRPPRTMAESIARDRKRRQQFKNRDGSLRKSVSSIYRQRSDFDPSKYSNPFGMDTFSPQELAAQTADSTETSTPEAEDRQREDRSAAPEPETPVSKSLFGSLRGLGSSLLGSVFSPITGRHARAGTEAPLPPQAQTEPRQRTAKPAAWDIDFSQPKSRPLRVDLLANDTPPAELSPEEETGSEKKRKDFIAKHGAPHPKYDHLHTQPKEGTLEDLPFPPYTPKTSSTPATNGSETYQMPESLRKHYDEKRRRREALLPSPKPAPPPTRAPLFGPDSHWARGTKNPRYQEHADGGAHPLFRQLAGEKRLHEEEEEEAPTQQPPIPSRRFQPYMEDESEDREPSLDAPSTPAAKRQKPNDYPQTPKSALKVPGSVSKGRSVVFNRDPVASVKRISPTVRSTDPAGIYDHKNGLFGSMEGLREQDPMEASPASTASYGNSPNTDFNTRANAAGLSYQRQVHPGSKLTKDLNSMGPDQSDMSPKKFEFQWRDPSNPDWRPTLANPRPGVFRLLDDDEEAEEQGKLDRLKAEELAKESGSASGSTGTPPPPPPSTPRMSHAELPTAVSTTPAASPASALEQTNLEKRRAEATKSKPRTSSRLAEVTTAQSRSPSPPPLDGSDGDEDISDSSAKTPSPTIGNSAIEPRWTWTNDTNEYLSADPNIPDFAYNDQLELIPSFALRTATGDYDDTIVGPDGMTELARQNFYGSKYDDVWAEKTFKFDTPITYEEAGLGDQQIHDLLRAAEEKNPELIMKVDERFAAEWDAHQKAIEGAMKEGKVLRAVYPFKEGVEGAMEI